MLTCCESTRPSSKRPRTSPSGSDATRVSTLTPLLVSAKKIGSLNAFGDEQTDADLHAEEICVKHFKKTEVVRAYMSKESPNV